MVVTSEEIYDGGDDQWSSVVTAFAHRRCRALVAKTREGKERPVALEDGIPKRTDRKDGWATSPDVRSKRGSCSGSGDSKNAFE